VSASSSAVGAPASSGTDVCRGCGVQASKHRPDCALCGALIDVPPMHVPALAGDQYWVAVRCSFNCSVCGHEAPINHFDTDGSMLCLRCGTDQRFDVAQWYEGVRVAHGIGDLAGPHPEGRFPSDHVSIAAYNEHKDVGLTSTLSGSQQSGTIMDERGVTTHSLKMLAAPGHPLCRTCRTPMAIDSLEPDRAITISCGHCREQRQFAFSDAGRGTAALAVVADEHETGCSEVGVQPGTGGAVAITCPNCGAGLDVTPSCTVVSCAHCNTTCRINERLLRQLGCDDPKPLMWWMLFEGTSKLRQKLERKAHKKARKKEAAANRARKKEEKARQRAQAQGQPVPTAARRGRSGRMSPSQMLIAVAAIVLVLVVAALAMSNRPANPSTSARPGAAVPQQRPKPPAPKPAIDLQWSGKVTKATGKSLKPGAACSLSIRSNLDQVESCQLQCGGETLYDSDKAVNGMSMFEFAAFEQPHPQQAGVWVYGVRLSDKGARTGRAQLMVDTKHEQAIVFSDSIPTFRVELSLAQHSAPRSGKPLSGKSKAR